MPGSAVRSNVQIKLALHANEPSPPADTSMGFFLSHGEGGRPHYSVTDVAPSSVLAQISAKGYIVDPMSNEVVFEKSAWDGPAGAYTERPGSNRPAFGVNVNFLRPKPTIGPKAYTIGRPSFVSTPPLVNITFAAADQSLNLDSGTELARFTVGDTVTITGTTNNNWTKVVVTSSTTKLTFASGVVDETPGATTVTARAISGPVQSFAVFPADGKFYIVAADNSDGKAWVYRLAGWSITSPSSGYWEYCYNAADAGDPLKLFAHNDVLYMPRAGANAYLYSTDGIAWTASNRAGDNKYSGGFASHNGVLHKYYKPAAHQQMPTSAATGINGGTAWNSADQIGDTSYDIVEMLSTLGALVFCKEDGVYTLDSGANIRPLVPDLASLFRVNNGFGSSIWDQKIVYPTVAGHLWALVEGSPTELTPSLQQEKPMEVLGSEQPNLSERMFSTLSVFPRLFGALLLTQLSRVLCLEHTQEGLLWRTFVEATTNLATSLGYSSGPTAGPVLWAATGNVGSYTFKPVCWPLWVGTDPLQDPLADFGSSAVIYEPWISPHPETNFRWGWLELLVTEKTVNSGKVTFQVDAYTEAGNQIITAQTVTFASTGITRVAIPFTNADISKCVSRRVRLVLTMGNTGASPEAHTPILLGYKVHAYALPTARRAFEMSITLPVSGVGRGLFRQNQARTFLNFLRSATLPITFTDPFNTSWSVHRASAQVQEAVVSEKGQLMGQVWKLVLMEEVTT